MKNFIIDENNRKKSVILSIEDYEALLNKLKNIKKYSEELEDELDINEANKVVRRKEEQVDFNLEDYV